jgi:hypothetical protein
MEGTVMAYTIKKVDVWMASIADRPGAAAEKLDALAAAKVNLEFVLARRDAPGKGLLFVAPIAGAAQCQAARKAGLAKSAALCALRIEGKNAAGLGACMTRTLAAAGLNVRGLSAIAIGRTCLCYLALDSTTDATKAQRLLVKALACCK